MSTARRYLVVGSGSIACRHIRNLKILFPNSVVGCVSARDRPLSPLETPADTAFDCLEQAIVWAPQFAIVASPAPLHLEHATSLLRNGIPTLIEKPISDTLDRYREARQALDIHREKVDVAYNLRFLPSARRMKELIDEGAVGRVFTVMVEAGQYLPDWRPGTDYRYSVSARPELGGGVLLELSHELDYVVWMFGRFDSVYCISGGGTLGIDVEERVDAILTRFDGVVVNLHLDFLQRSISRSCKVIGERGNIVWDLVENSITLYGGTGSGKVLYCDRGYDRNQMYLDELSHFEKVAKGLALPSVDVGTAAYTLQLINALKHSSATNQVVNLGRLD